MWLILAFGCRSPAVTAFLDDRALAICARHARCDTLADAGYTDADGAGSEVVCLDAVNAATGALAEEGALGCGTFDATAADACVAVYADTACGEVLDLAECDQVCLD